MAIQDSGRKLDIAIIIILLLGIAYFAFDKFVLDPGRDEALVEEAVKSAIELAELAAAETTDASIAVLPFVADSIKHPFGVWGEYSRHNRTAPVRSNHPM